MQFLKVISACFAIMDCTGFRNREQVDRKLLTIGLGERVTCTSLVAMGLGKKEQILDIL